MNTSTLKQDWPTALLVGAVLLAVVVSMIGHHATLNDGCKWIAPLKVNYVMCPDGKVYKR